MIETKDLTITEEAKTLDQWKSSTIKALTPILNKAKEIRAKVRGMVSAFSDENYFDNPEGTKKDRAALNKSAEFLNDNRKVVEREYMAPFYPIRDEIDAAVRDIKYAASRLDEIDKDNEETRRNEKRRDIEGYFKEKNFTLVPFDQLFDVRWTNKTTKITEIHKELDAKIADVYANLKLLDNFGGDAQSLKALYLDSLDIGAAMRQAAALKANRERVAQEKAERPEREHTSKINEQRKELAIDAEAERVADQMSSLASDALEVEKDPIIS
jgi:hypothetical protein